MNGRGMVQAAERAASALLPALHTNCPDVKQHKRASVRRKAAMHANVQPACAQPAHALRAPSRSTHFYSQHLAMGLRRTHGQPSPPIVGPMERSRD